LNGGFGWPVAGGVMRCIRGDIAIIGVAFAILDQFYPFHFSKAAKVSGPGG